jgi:hypothetical protein
MDEISKPVPLQEIEMEITNFNYEYFKERGLETKWYDSIAYNYCKMNRNTFIVVLYPSAVGNQEETKCILNKYGEIFYEKEIHLKAEGPKNLIVQLYKGEKWLGGQDEDYQGAYEKVIPCFNRKGPVRVFVFEPDNQKNILQVKEDIRSLYNIGKHSVHINDTHEETLQLAQLFFNENSIHFLNYARPNSYKKFVKLVNQYKSFISNRKYDSDNFCVDTSAVLAAYGIREPSDLDFIHHDYDQISGINFEKLGISSHNNELMHHTYSKDDIIFNPDNHFYYDGLKFASLSVIKDMKTKRGELKDLEDIRLINNFLRKREFDIELMVQYMALKYRTNVLKLKSKGKNLIQKIIR